MSSVHRKIQIVQRDETILLDVFNYGYLKTSMIHKLHFDGNTKFQAAQRRLFRLKKAGYLDTLYSSKTNKACYKLGSSMGIQFISMKTGIDPQEIKNILACRDSESLAMLEHQLKVSNIRLNAELALKNNEVAIIKRWISWGDYENNGKNLKKVLHETVRDSRLGTYRSVIPDSGFIIKGKDGSKYEGFESLFFVECDLGTEDIGRIAQKFIGYGLLFSQQKYLKYGNFKGFKVLFITTSHKRIKNIRNSLSGTYGVERILFTTYDEITLQSVFSDEIWLNISGEKKKIIKV